MLGICLAAQSCPTLATPWTVARQVPLSMGFPRQECWSGLPFSSSGDLPNPGIEPTSPVSPGLSGEFFTTSAIYKIGLPTWLSGQESNCHAGDAEDRGLIPGWGRSPEEENGNPLQYSCLENSMDKGAWWAILHGVAKSWARLSD